jgi:hypothetical protein
VANGRRSKNHISAVRVGEELITDQDKKVEAFTEAYVQLLGTAHARDYTLNLRELDIPAADLHELDALFSEEEVWSVVRELHPDRAPGPDGFTGAFYQQAWPVIKNDVMAGILKLGVGDGHGFARLNRALITLIPKKQDSMETKDYRQSAWCTASPSCSPKFWLIGCVGGWER